MQGQYSVPLVNQLDFLCLCVGYILGVCISSHHYLYWRTRADCVDSLHVLAVDTMKTPVSGSGWLQGHMHFMALCYNHWIYVIPNRGIKAVFSFACRIEIIVIPNIFINCPFFFYYSKLQASTKTEKSYHAM